MRSTTSGSVRSCVLAPSKVSASRGTRTAGPALMAATDKGALGPAPCVAGNGDVELGDVPNGTVKLVRFTLTSTGYSCLHSSMVSLLCCGLGIGTPTTAAVSGRCPKPDARRERCGHVSALLCQTAGPGRAVHESAPLRGALRQIVAYVFGHGGHTMRATTAHQKILRVRQNRSTGPVRSE